MKTQWILAAAISAAAAGCLRREETITVKADKSVRVVLKYEGNIEDFETADALPSERSGWAVESSTDVEENGEVTRLLRADRGFEPGQALPSSFGAHDDEDADLYTSFPTSIHTEQRKDGEYLYFRRTYQPRSWAYVNYWAEEFLDEKNRKLAQKPVEELTRDERVQLLSAIAGVELYKQLEFAQEAMRASDPDLTPECWLKARAAVIEAGKDIDWGTLVDRVAGLDAEGRDAEFEREAQRMQTQSYEILIRTLQEASGYGQREIDAFETAFGRAVKRYTITHEIGGQNFLIRVQLPGELIAHNADKVEEGGFVVWDFSGEAFRDRPYELVAVSKLPLESHR